MQNEKRRFEIVEELLPMATWIHYGIEKVHYYDFNNKTDKIFLIEIDDVNVGKTHQILSFGRGKDEDAKRKDALRRIVREMCDGRELIINYDYDFIFNYSYILTCNRDQLKGLSMDEINKFIENKYYKIKYYNIFYIEKSKVRFGTSFKKIETTIIDFNKFTDKPEITEDEEEFIFCD